MNHSRTMAHSLASDVARFQRRIVLLSIPLSLAFALAFVQFLT